MQKINRRSAGIIVVKRDSVWSYLLLRAYRNWDFPKGEVKPQESPLVAAIRETQEETGLSKLDFSWGYVFRETEIYNRGKMARYYLARTSTEKVVLPISMELGRPEHEEYRWSKYQEAYKLLPGRLQLILNWAQSYIDNELTCY